MSVSWSVLNLISDRIRALGGDPDRVPASPSGVPAGLGAGGAESGCLPLDRSPVCRFDGKITGVVCDCFGDFKGFVLDVCGKEIRFDAREHEIEALVRLAWRERIAITVVVRVADQRRLISIILQRAPEPFQS